MHYRFEKQKNPRKHNDRRLKENEENDINRASRTEGGEDEIKLNDFSAQRLVPQFVHTFHLCLNALYCMFMENLDCLASQSFSLGFFFKLCMNCRCLQINLVLL